MMTGLVWLEQSGVAAAMTAWPALYIVVSAAHILSIGLIIGAILPLDLRLLGFFRQAPLAAIAPLLSRTATAGVACALVTGVLLFTVRAREYAANPAFLIKLGLVAFAILNAVMLHRGLAWKEALARDGHPALSVRIAAMLSLVLWPGAVLAGRWIGFL
ncbi:MULTISPECIES: DUF6644 family protein [Rhizobium/Agrobacterium group]|uniref:DUF6644 domain-containing protein n=1 Tax=Pararhizobium antarcticum TaxID=1798805 RepID=A0A657LMX5_9HYPH|nr:hypothetical protein AX760_22740 [Pararhizobium antarcticum]OJF99172.1 hypothetical protein AX761_11720 [Rhizobium sp. 58]